MKLKLTSTFSKRKNETKCPTSFQKEYDVYLKVDTDYDEPTFVIRDANQLFPVYTYAYLEDIGRYYFITSCKQRNANCWEIVCELDFLATYKSAIQATTAFVAYSSTDYDVLLSDPRVPKKNASRILTSSPYATPFGGSSYDFLWVSGTNGTVCYRVNLAQVTAAIFNASNDDLLDNLCQTWADIQSCILYCRSYDLGAGSVPSGTAEHVQIGKYDTGVQGVRVSASDMILTRSGTISITIPKTYTDFRRFTFSDMKLSLPFVGVVNLSISDFVENPALDYHVNVELVANLMSGVVVYKVTNDEGAVIGTYNGVAGRAKPVSLYSPYNGAGVLTSSGAAIAGAATVALATGPVGIAAGIGAAIAGLAGAVTASETTSGSTIGSNDGSAEEKINNTIILTVEEYESHIEPSNLLTIAGRPCSKVRSLSGLTDYVQTCGASVSVNANSNVIDNLNAALDTGIYIT